MNIPKDILQLDGKVILQLSGGKDSIACLILLHQNNINVECIHFVHSYSYELPTKMAIEICDRLGVNLHIVDITDKLTTLFLNNFNMRPCRYCKAILDTETISYAHDLSCNYICVGDSGDDTMLVNRLKRLEGDASFFSRYLNANVDLPEDLSIIRPLLKSDGTETLRFVKQYFPEFSRVNDTGDKYFEYSREGCPLQFKDLGAFYTKSLMDQLLRYNMLCSDFATAYGIKAAIHLPSEFIVTIPKGFEEQCRQYLLDNGCCLKRTPSIIKEHLTTIYIKDIELKNISTIGLAVRRLMERCGYPEGKTTECTHGIMMTASGYHLNATLLNELLCITIATQHQLDITSLNDICMEIFHTYRFHINSTEI